MADKQQAILEALSRLESMLDDMDVKTSRSMLKGPGEDNETTSGTDSDLDAGDSAPDEEAQLADDKPDAGNEEAAQDEAPSGSLEDELSALADQGNPGSKGALSFFAKEEPDGDEEDEEESQD